MADEPRVRRIATEEAFAVPEQFEGADNIMWAIDYPYQQTPECVAFMDSAPIAGEDRDKIYASNAERVFGIGTPAAAAS